MKGKLKKGQFAVIGGPMAGSFFFLPYPGVDNPTSEQLPDIIRYDTGKYNRVYNYKDQANTYVWQPDEE